MHRLVGGSGGIPPQENLENLDRVRVLLKPSENATIFVATAWSECVGGSGGTPAGNFEILHALKCVLGAIEALFRAWTQYILASCRCQRRE